MKKKDSNIIKGEKVGEERTFSAILREKTAVILGLFVLSTVILVVFIEILHAYQWAYARLSDGLKEAYSTTLGNSNYVTFNVCDSIVKESDNMELPFDRNEFLSSKAKVSGGDDMLVFDGEGRCVCSSDERFLGGSIDDDSEEMALFRDIFQMTKEAQLFECDKLLDKYPEYFNDGKMDYYGYYVNEDHQIASKGSVVIFGVYEDHTQRHLLSLLCVFAYNAIVGQDGGFMILSEDEEKPGQYLVSGGRNITPVSYSDDPGQIDTIDFPVDEHGEGKIFYHKLGDERFLCMYKKIAGILCVAMIPVSTEMKMIVGKNTLFVLVCLVLLVIMMNIVLQQILRISVLEPIGKMEKTLDVISAGSLDTEMNVRDNLEFSVLSDDINGMVLTLKQYIREASERIDRELSIARSIQLSSVPNTFPDRKEFELFASTEPAKEVGGDFYDYYMVDDDTLGFLMADVSGKSIPGAMFMMTGKTTIKDKVERGMQPGQVFAAANKELSAENDALMFITAWLGYLDIKTGVVRAVNAGHNPPVLIRDGKAEFVTLDPGMVLAVMDGMEYQEQTIQLQKGDILYLYTDGVTEAIDPDENEYGDERLLKLLSFGDDYPDPTGDNGMAGAVCELVKADIKLFVRGADQFDDITMLCIIYN